SSRTLSPRNSSRSYDSERSSAQEACLKTCSSRAGGSSPISRPSSSEVSLLGLVCDDVVDRLADGRELARVVVGDLQVELVLQVHDDLHEVERVGAEVFLERRVFRDLAFVDAELLAERAFDLLENLLTRMCHLENLASWPPWSWSARMLPRSL